MKETLIYHMVELSDHGTLKETLIYHMVELSDHGTLKRNIDISHGRGCHTMVP